MRTLRMAVGMIAAAALVLVAAHAWGADSAVPAKVLVDKTVTVAGEGGSAEVSFTATKGEKIKISLKASPSSMEPYGFLEKAGGGNGEYRPANGNSKGGKNEAEVTISRAGKYSLTVFDGSNAGGSVRVLITEIKEKESEK